MSVIFLRLPNADSRVLEASCLFMYRVYLSFPGSFQTPLLSKLGLFILLILLISLNVFILAVRPGVPSPAVSMRICRSPAVRCTRLSHPYSIHFINAKIILCLHSIPFIGKFWNILLCSIFPPPHDLDSYKKELSRQHENSVNHALSGTLLPSVFLEAANIGSFYF